MRYANAGVQINSWAADEAFYLAGRTIGEIANDLQGQVCYKDLTDRKLDYQRQLFNDFAQKTVDIDDHISISLLLRLLKIGGRLFVSSFGWGTWLSKTQLALSLKREIGVEVHVRTVRLTPARAVIIKLA